MDNGCSNKMIGNASLLTDIQIWRQKLGGNIGIDLAFLSPQLTISLSTHRELALLFFVFVFHSLCLSLSTTLSQVSRPLSSTFESPSSTARSFTRPFLPSFSCVAFSTRTWLSPLLHANSPCVTNRRAEHCSSRNFAEIFVGNFVNWPRTLFHPFSFSLQKQHQLVAKETI